MRRLLIVLTLILSGASVLLAQKTEISISLNSGLSYFGGKDAQKETFFIYREPGTSNGYTNSPYGAKMAIPYGLSGNIKRINARGFVYGADLGYEVLRSKIAITKTFSSPGDAGNSGIDAEGKTFLNFAFLTISPQAGYRANAGNMSIDITGGFDIGYCLKGREKGRVTIEDGKELTSSVDRKKIEADIRPRFQLTANYGQAGIYVGYSYGLINYSSGMVGSSSEAYSRMLRLGLMYRIR